MPEAIIESILDTDLYKLTMQQAVIREFPGIDVRYDLIIRTPREFRATFAEELKEQIQAMAGLSLTPKERDFLKEKGYFFTGPYIDFLSGYRFNPDEVLVGQMGETIRMRIEGPWYRTILWETPLMATISELYFKNEEVIPGAQRYKIMADKANYLRRIGAPYADFGTRRRYSKRNHSMLIQACKLESPKTFIGTSNPHFANIYGTKMVGTQAHELYMVIGVLYGYPSANRIALEKWVDVYQGDLGVALTDTFTTDAFFPSFTTKFAKLFDGIRQDSGDPIEFAKKAIAHYEKLRIDPKTKTIVFSDGLNKETVKKINHFCKGKVKASFGIGTNLTNDVGVKPLNMVIKLTAVSVGREWLPTVKLSDNPGKHTGTEEAVSFCKRTLKLK